MANIEEIADMIKEDWHRMVRNLDENNKTITRLITERNDWKFKGHVVSDCWAITDIDKGHKFTLDPVESAALSLKKVFFNWDKKQPFFCPCFLRAKARGCSPTYTTNKQKGKKKVQFFVLFVDGQLSNKANTRKKRRHTKHRTKPT